MLRPKAILLAGLALLGSWLSGRPAQAVEYVLLGRGISVDERARQLQSGAWLAPLGSRNGPPPADWMQPSYDDSAWLALPAKPPRSHVSPSPPGTLWVSPSPHAAPPLPDAGLIFTDDGIADGGAGAATDAGAAKESPPPAAAGVAPALPMAGTTVPPPCAGTLYLRRRFSLHSVDGQAAGDEGGGALLRPAEVSRLSTLTLRIRYSDGFVAYLNGVELVRRRLPEPAQSEPSTLAAERGTVEPESHHLSLPVSLLLPEGNVLAVEVHPRAIERCPRAELELLASDGPRVIRGPFIEGLRDGVLELTLETDSPTRVRVAYGKGELKQARDRLLADDPEQPAQTAHRIRVSGLRPGTDYHYQVTVAGPNGTHVDLPLVPFHTPPAAGRPLRVVVYGDSRSGHAIHAQVVQSILSEEPDLVLSIGDLVERGSEDSDWDRFFAVAAPLLQKVPFYLAPGNHEYARRGQGSAKLFQIWSRQFPIQSPPPAPLPQRVLALPRSPIEPSLDSGPRGYYSFDVAGVHFVGLDSNQLRAPEQQRWLEADLAQSATKKPRAVIVWMHDGPYSMGWHGDNNGLIRDYVPLLERYKVSVLFSGHDHDYERGHRGRLDYIVTGGGGAELRPLKCGVPGKRRCKHPPLAFYNEHNYVAMEILPGLLRLCPKRPDGSALEPCQLLSLKR